MKTKLALQSPIRFANRLKKLRKLRVQGKLINRVRRKSLTKADRFEILEKTGSRCHICGGKIKEKNWQADHIFPHVYGGKHSLDNYLPAHSICNNYRWHYGEEEFQWILKLGVWIRTQIEKQDRLGVDLAEKFVKYERVRISRQKIKS